VPPLSASPDIVVVGGGCIGLACAAALANRGLKVHLLERDLPGAGSTTLTGGGIRQQFGTELNIRMSRLSAAFWLDFELHCGVDPLFRRIGYLFLASRDEEAEALVRNVSLQNSLGVTSEYLGEEDIARRWPELGGRGFRAAGFLAEDGWANHHRISDGLLRAAQAAGVTVTVGTEALRLRMSAGKTIGVATPDGDFDAGAVLVACGAWDSRLLASAGLPGFPVVGRRHELLLVEPKAPLPAGLPWLIGVADQVHLRPDVAGRALVGGFLGEDRPVDVDDFERRPDPGWRAKVLSKAAQAFGVTEDRPRVVRGWSGLYPSTPDRHPIIDRVNRGLFVASGFSGTGLMHAPAAALLAAELIVDGAISSVAAEQLSLSRFLRGADTRAETTGF
jgi:sarcosine oxidase subunit beta